MLKINEHAIQNNERDIKSLTPVISIISNTISMSIKNVIKDNNNKIKTTTLNDSTNYQKYIKPYCLRMESNQRPLGFQPNALPLSYLSIITLYKLIQENKIRAANN
jgi:hypothetical protein